MRSSLDNSYNRNRVRIDARTGDSRTRGFRNVHRDTDGTIIGGVNATGSRFGSRVPQGPADGSSLGNPVTPGIDKWRQPVQQPAAPATDIPETRTMEFQNSPVKGMDMRDYQKQFGTNPVLQGMTQPAAPVPQPPATPSAPLRESFAQTDARKRQESATSGAFGTAAQAKAKTSAFRSIVQGQPQPAAPIAQQPARTSPTAAPAATAAPQFGKAIAQANIASKGTMGAIADYQARSAAEKTQKVQSKWRTASAMPAAAPPMSPAATPKRNFRQTAGLPAAAPPIAKAPNFTVPPVANPQAIGDRTQSAPPPSNRPAQVPTPQVMPAARPPAKTLTGKPYTDGLSAKFSGPGGFRDPKVVAELARQQQEKAKRDAKNAANRGKGSTRPGVLSRNFGAKPSWMAGSIVGSIYDAADK